MIINRVQLSIFTLFMCGLSYSLVVCSQQNSAGKAIEKVKSAENLAQKTGKVLFAPVTVDGAPNPYPTNSMNEKLVETFYGSKGLNVPQNLLTDIKRFYFYLEYAAKLETAAKLVHYGQYSLNIDTFSMLSKPKPWQSIKKAAIEKEKNWAGVLGDLRFEDRGAYKAIQGSVSFNSWSEVPKSDFWNHLDITLEELVNSMFWQKYLKYNITQFFDQIDSALDGIVEGEQRMFMFIPHIMIAYYNQDYNNLRHSVELFRVRLLLNERVQKRMIAQTLDWRLHTLAGSKQQEFDLVKIYQQVPDFKKSSFYQMMQPVDKDILELAQSLAQHKPLFADKKYIKQPYAHTELTIMAMITNLQARLAFLFDDKHIDQTMQFLKTIQKQAKKHRRDIRLFTKDAILPTPHILWYDYQDEAIFEDINYLLDKFKQVAQQKEENLATSKTDKNDQAKVQGFIGWVKKAAHKTEKAFSSAGNAITKGSGQALDVLKKMLGSDDFKIFKQKTLDASKNELTKAADTLAEDAKKAGKDISKAVVKEGLAIYKGSEGAAILISGHPDKAKRLFNESVDLQTQVADKMQHVTKDTTQLLNDTVTLSSKVAYLSTAYTVGSALTAISQDPDLGESVSRAVESSVDAALKVSEFLIAGPIDLVLLTPELVSRLTTIFEKTIVDLAKGKAPWYDWKDELGSLVKTFVNQATFWGKIGYDFYSDLVKSMAYIITMTADALIDSLIEFFQVAEDVAKLFGTDAGLKGAETFVKEHKRTAVQLTGVAFVFGSIIATGGATAPLLAMGLGPQAFMVVGGVQDDEAAATKKAAQKQFLSDYKKFISQNETIAKQSKEAFLQEINVKFGDQENNQERELGFYQSMLAQYIEESEQQLSYAAGNFLAPQLKQDQKTNARFADLASLYGYQTGSNPYTGVFNLNPSQGFALYNKARDSFGQEIAVYPAPTIGGKQDNFVSDVQTKFWFNQKETVILNESFSTIHVRFLPIYVLNSFYVGLYIGGKFINIKETITTKQAPIGAAHLAKMLVYKKEDKNSPTKLGLYEHEGEGWLSEQLTGPSFSLGQWYHMKAELADDNIKVKVWQENEKEPEWQSFKVKETQNKKIIGMISSGASIEYQYITPSIPVRLNETVRKPEDQKTEFQRGKQLLQELKKDMSVNVGKSTLKALDEGALVHEQYIYTTTLNGLPEIVILATEAKQGQLTNIGAAPHASVQVNNRSESLIDTPLLRMISVVTALLYNTNGQVVGYQPSILDNMQKLIGPLKPVVNQRIKAEREQFINRLQEPVKFGSIDLSIASVSDAKKGIYIYKALSPDALLRTNNTPLTDNGKQIYDYFMMLDKQGLLGGIHTSDTQAIQSLVTGNVYERTSSKPVQTGFITGKSALAEYIAQDVSISSEMQKKVEHATQLYDSLRKVSAGTKKHTSVSTYQVVSKFRVPEKKKREQAVQQPSADPASTSLEKRSRSAESGQVAWGA